MKKVIIKIQGRLRELRRSLYNLLYYFKVIWDDRDWDYVYMEDLTLAKFRKAYKFRTTSEWYMASVGDEKDNQALRICINILERRTGNWYVELWSKDSLKYNALVTDALEERDWRNYCRIVEKWQRHWWD